MFFYMQIGNSEVSSECVLTVCVPVIFCCYDSNPIRMLPYYCLPITFWKTISTTSLVSIRDWATANITNQIRLQQLIYTHNLLHNPQAKKTIVVNWQG